MICELVKWNLVHFAEDREREMEEIIPRHSVKPTHWQRNYRSFQGKKRCRWLL